MAEESQQMIKMSEVPRVLETAPRCTCSVNVIREGGPCVCENAVDR